MAGSVTLVDNMENKNKQLQFDKSYIRMAYEWAKNSYALRRKVGCLIVKDRMIISDGYNGMPSGFPNVCEDYRPLHLSHFQKSESKEELDEVLKLYPDTETKTKEEVLHAESNAITKLARSHNSSDGATLYVTCQPCFDCAKLIIQAGIKRVVYAADYHTQDGINLLKRAGIEVVKIEL